MNSFTAVPSRAESVPRDFPEHSKIARDKSRWSRATPLRGIHSVATPITVLGQGPMGRALTQAFLTAGHPTTVWNRTAAKAAGSVAAGAILADSPGAAVEAAELVVVNVIDYDAVEAIVRPVATQLKGRTLVNLVADTPCRARRLAGWAEENGIDYLDGAIMVPTTAVGTPESLIFYAGDERLYQAHKPALDALGGGTYVGADPGRAASMDVPLLDMFFHGYAGLAHGFALAKAEGIDPADLAPYAKMITGLVPQFVEEHVRRMQEQDYGDDLSSIRSMAAGLSHIADTAEENRLDAGSVRAVQAILRRAIEAGRGDDSLGKLTDLFGEVTA
ncbi:NAD(P)-dependent oxidoreductase [Pseudonocardiaceae bacterium YIM PH 21723]|nr:NAD(P)-dependent oxidoreductase [Pseudonocardiaceae bacterium YIM PH 21723]